ncbi:MAG: hypothetical protein ACLS5R_09320 [Blautia sp.]
MRWLAYVSEMGYRNSEIPSLAEDGSGDARATAGTGCDRQPLKGVYFQLAYMDVEDDILLYLGRDNDIDMDWENAL